MSELNFPSDMLPVLAKIQSQNSLGLSVFHEVVYFDDSIGRWKSFAGSNTFNDGESVISWAYADGIIEQSIELEQLRKALEEAKALVKSSFGEAYSLGYFDGNSDGQSYRGRTCRDDEGQWDSSDSFEALAKLNKQSGE